MFARPQLIKRKVRDVRQTIETLIRDALQAAIDAGELEMPEIPDPSVERPRDETHGDWASTVALKCAKLARKKPGDIAEIVAA
jgi:arginyl-tRNA synthetase